MLEESPPQQEDLVLVGVPSPVDLRLPTWLLLRDYTLTSPGVSLDEGRCDVLEESLPQQEDLFLVGVPSPVDLRLPTLAIPMRLPTPLPYLESVWMREAVMCWRSPRLNRKIWSWYEVKPLLTSPGVSLDEGCCDVLEESPPQQEDLVLV